MIELLVVVAILGVLAGLLVPALAGAREKSRRAQCMSNLRQLHLANTLYAEDYGFYVAAAPDVMGANLRRWHGVRTSTGAAFDGTKGPLVRYLGASADIRQCPSFPADPLPASVKAFEQSCGGYGYNMLGVGSRIYQLGYCEPAMATGVRASAIRHPARTVMFADTAFPQPYGPKPTCLIEYSFAEAYHWVFEPGAESSVMADPSIHFRHAGRANVVWCDGHVSSETLDTPAAPSFTKWKVGWFGPADNTLFAP